MHTGIGHQESASSKRKGKGKGARQIETGNGDDKGKGDEKGKGKGKGKEKDGGEPEKENAEEGKGKAKGKGRSREFEVFVGGLPFGRSVEDIKKDFGALGETERFHMPQDDGQHKGLAFINYLTKEGMDKALAFHETDYGGAWIRVFQADKAKGNGKGKGKEKGKDDGDKEAAAADPM
eukprot:CAMPEP_0183443240 /NCGR_PEP_ID=MMETSP0370-20130417/91026_1 /TAXON_ID=268820 /ORGANISM="Peridinium aciculiferum, Strain PAER-2" /LENGTH=177 /DNA_ID=CAMNT_0025633149 /DNA_START=35 /DNA_END=568 /DNA_ORIENTATION=-